MKSAVESVIATLELTGSEHSDLLDFQVDVLFNSAWRYAMIELAVLIDVELRRVGVTMYQACLDLGKLERKRGWKHPAEVLDSPNLAALCRVCQARAARVQAQTRRRKLEAVSRKLERAYRQDRASGWIGALVRRPTSGGAAAQNADENPEGAQN